MGKVVKKDDIKHIATVTVICMLMYFPYWTCKMACEELTKNIYIQAALPYFFLSVVGIVFFQTDKARDRLREQKKVSINEFINIVIFQSSSSYCLLFIVSIINRLIFDIKGNADTITNVTILVMLILAPITEEFVFRWILYDRLRSIGYKKTVAVTSLIFALMHVFSQGATQAIYVFWLSIIWCYAKERYNSYFINVVLHMLSNIWCGILPIAISQISVAPILYLLVNFNCLLLLITKRGKLC